MKFMKTSIRWMALLLVLCLATTAMIGCTDRTQLPDGAGEQEDEEKTPPRLENNTVAQLSFTTLWYRPEMFVSDGVEVVDPYARQCMIALFNNVEFRSLTTDDGVSVTDIYLEMKESQYLLLEGCGTIFVCDNGRAMLTLINQGQYFTDVGAVDAEALRQIGLPLMESVKSEAEQP